MKDKITKWTALLFLLTTILGLVLATPTQKPGLGRRIILRSRSPANLQLQLRSSRQTPDIPALYSAPPKNNEKQSEPNSLYGPPEAESDMMPTTETVTEESLSEGASTPSTEEEQDDMMMDNEVTERYLPPQAKAIKDQQMIENNPFHQIQIHVVPPHLSQGDDNNEILRNSYGVPESSSESVPQFGRSNNGQYLPPQGRGQSEEGESSHEEAGYNQSRNQEQEKLQEQAPSQEVETPRMDGNNVEKLKNQIYHVPTTYSYTHHSQDIAPQQQQYETPQQRQFENQGYSQRQQQATGYQQQTPREEQNYSGNQNYFGNQYPQHNQRDQEPQQRQAYQEPQQYNRQNTANEDYQNQPGNQNQPGQSYRNEAQGYSQPQQSHKQDYQRSQEQSTPQQGYRSSQFPQQQQGYNTPQNHFSQPQNNQIAEDHDAVVIQEPKQKPPQNFYGPQNQQGQQQLATPPQGYQSYQKKPESQRNYAYDQQQPRDQQGGYSYPQPSHDNQGYPQPQRSTTQTSQPFSQAQYFQGSFQPQSRTNSIDIGQEQEEELEGLNGRIVDAALLERVQKIIEEHEREQKALLANLNSNSLNSKSLDSSSGYSSPQPQIPEFQQHDYNSPSAPEQQSQGYGKNANQDEPRNDGIQYQKAYLSNQFMEPIKSDQQATQTSSPLSSQQYLPVDAQEQGSSKSSSSGLRLIPAPQLGSQQPQQLQEEDTPKPIYGIPLAPVIGLDSSENFKVVDDPSFPNQSPNYGAPLNNYLSPKPQSTFYGRNRRRVGRVMRLSPVRTHYFF